MNDAHLHLAINHFPIIGLTIGIKVSSKNFDLSKS